MRIGRPGITAQARETSGEPKRATNSARPIDKITVDASSDNPVTEEGVPLSGGANHGSSGITCGAARARSRRSRTRACCSSASPRSRKS